MNKPKLIELHKTAFVKYLRQQDFKTALNHMIKCLRCGESGNSALEVMEAVYGPTWSVAPEAMPQYVENALFVLAETEGEME